MHVLFHFKGRVRPSAMRNGQLGQSAEGGFSIQVRIILLGI